MKSKIVLSFRSKDIIITPTVRSNPQLNTFINDNKQVENSNTNTN